MYDYDEIDSKSQTCSDTGVQSGIDIDELLAIFGIYSPEFASEVKKAKEFLIIRKRAMNLTSHQPKSAFRHLHDNLCV